jgi:hypothetical protein
MCDVTGQTVEQEFGLKLPLSRVAVVERGFQFVGAGLGAVDGVAAAARSAWATSSMIRPRLSGAAPSANGRMKNLRNSPRSM